MIADAAMGLADDGRRPVDAMIRVNSDGGTTPEDSQYQLFQHYPRPHVIPNSSSSPLWTTLSLVEPSELQRVAVNGLDSADSAFFRLHRYWKTARPPIDSLLHHTQANRKQFNNQRKSLLAWIIYHARLHIYYGSRQPLEHRFFDLVLQRTHVVISSCVFNKPSEDVAGFYSCPLVFV